MRCVIFVNFGSRFRTLMPLYRMCAFLLYFTIYIEKNSLKYNFSDKTELFQYYGDQSLFT